jgi:hypothetical protein
MERDKTKQSESVEQTFPQLPWKQKKGGFKKHLDSFHQTGNCSKACPTDSDLLAYLVPLDVYVTGNITAKICEIWSEFNIFAPWLPWQRPPF